MSNTTEFAPSNGFVPSAEREALRWETKAERLNRAERSALTRIFPEPPAPRRIGR